LTVEIICTRKREREGGWWWRDMSDNKEEDVKANESERFTGQLSIEERVGGKEGEEGGRME